MQHSGWKHELAARSRTSSSGLASSFLQIRWISGSFMYVSPFTAGSGASCQLWHCKCRGLTGAGGRPCFRAYLPSFPKVMAPIHPAAAAEGCWEMRIFHIIHAPSGRPSTVHQHTSIESHLHRDRGIILKPLKGQLTRISHSPVWVPNTAPWASIFHSDPFLPARMPWP